MNPVLKTPIAVPEILLGDKGAEIARADIVAAEAGIFCGHDAIREKAQALSLTITQLLCDGAPVTEGQIAASFQGAIIDLLAGEDQLLSVIGKPSGVVTVCIKALIESGGMKIVSGGWKKVPLETKKMIQGAIKTAGVGLKITDNPFVYLDKNYITVFGSPQDAVRRGKGCFPDREIAVQVKGTWATISEEALYSVREGAGIVIVDTGRITDLISCHEALLSTGMRNQVKLAFSGGVRIEDLPDIKKACADIVDMGRTLLDARILDFRYNIVMVN